jgi:hypothetical protein
MTRWLLRSPERPPSFVQVEWAMATDTKGGPRLSWSPHGLIARAAAEPLDNFCAEFLGAYFLVVRLDDFSSELADGLNMSKPDSMVRRRGQHATSSLTSQREQTGLISVRSTMRAPAPRSRLAASEEFNAGPDLLRSACHVAEIKKRRPEPPLGLVSIGRALDRDIILLHPSVSKSHAQFDDVDGLFVTDLGSSNQTFVNGAPTVGRVPVAAGDFIKFGAVRCAVCSAAGLWRAVHT